LRLQRFKTFWLETFSEKPFRLKGFLKTLPPEVFWIPFPTETVLKNPFSRKGFAETTSSGSGLTPSR
jgi:hypothetical protein